MNKAGTIAVCTLAAATLLSYALPATAADDLSWYAGAGLGRGDAKRTGSWAEHADLAFRTQGVTSLTTISNGNSAWKMFGGYVFNENVSVEAAYSRLGRFGGTSTVTAPAAGTGSGTWDASALSLAAIGSLPIHENRVAATGKLGLARTRLGVSAAASGGGTSAAFGPSNDRINLMLGVGMRFDLTKQFGVRAEYDYYNNVGDGTTTGQTGVAVWSLNGFYRF